MESQRIIVIAVKLQDTNYMVWSHLVKIALEGKGLWSHCVENAPNVPKAAVTLAGGEAGSSSYFEEKWQQKDLMVFSSLLSSLAPTLLDAYSYCESTRELWSTLSKIYGNLSNTSRVFEIKKAIIDLSQEEEEFTTHLGKLSTLWSELERLRPQSIDPEELNERREQDRVIDLLLTLKPAYNNLIKQILRSEKLPTLEEVCTQVQKEECSMGLFKTKETLSFASHAEGSTQRSKAVHKEGDRGSMMCDHYKEDGHLKKSCLVLNPKLRPAKFK